MLIRIVEAAYTFTKHFTKIKLCNPHSNPIKLMLLSQYVDEETGALKIRCLAKGHISLVSGEHRFKSRGSGFRDRVLNIPFPSVI